MRMKKEKKPGKLIPLLKKHKRLFLCGAGVLLILLVIAGIFLPKGGDSNFGEISSAKAEKMTIRDTLSADGEIDSVLEEALAPHASYYLESVDAAEGDALAEGDVILTYTNGKTMTAPYACVVETLTLPDEDEQLTSAHSVTVAATDELQMTLSVEEGDISALSLGDEASITASAVDQTYQGYVTYISEVGTYSSGSSTFTVKVSLKNDGNLKIGMSGTASILLAEAKDVLGVPLGAIQNNGDKTTVFVVADDGSTKSVSVETGLSNDSYIEIKSGLTEGQQVQVITTDEEDSGRMEGFGGMGGMGGEMPSGGEMPEMPSGGGTPPGQ